jgi:hypothetical protein
MAWANSVAHVLAWLVVAMQVGFGALEMFAPRWVFDRVRSPRPLVPAAPDARLPTA